MQLLLPPLVSQGVEVSEKTGVRPRGKILLLGIIIGCPVSNREAPLGFGALQGIYWSVVGFFGGGLFWYPLNHYLRRTLSGYL